MTQPGTIFKLCEFDEGRRNTGVALIFRAVKDHPKNAKLLRGTAAAHVTAALKSDCIETNHTGRTVDTILSVRWSFQSSVSAFTVGSGLSWEHVRMEYIVANVYMALRTCCFGVRDEPTSLLVLRSIDFLRDHYPHGMAHFLNSYSHHDTPATKVPPIMQPPRSAGNELHRAAQLGSAKRTAALLESGTIDVDERDCYGYTPLILAAYVSRPRVVALLLWAGANASAANDEGYTPLAASVKNEDIPTTAMLVKAGADVNARYGDGRFPIYDATCNENIAMVNLLLQSGADATTPVTDGQTPLHLAAG